jgi:hypothetical protein
MSKNIKDIAASVHQRLLNKAKNTTRPFNELLQHFAIERFIYRISKSPHSNRFFLKGALLSSAWTGLESRPTMDIDLLGKIDNSLEVIIAAMKDACEMEVDPDGMAFHSETVSAARITDAPGFFENIATAVKAFLKPIVGSIVDRKTFHGIWTAPGPWR